MLTNFRRDLELVDGLETDYLKLLYYDLAPMTSDYKSYEYSRLCTILEGRKHISVNKDSGFTYRPSQFILLPPHSSVHMDIDIHTRALVLEINDSLLRSVIEKIILDIDADYASLKEDRFFLGDIEQGLRRCLNSLATVSMTSDKNKEFLMDLYAQELVYHLVKVKGIQQVMTLEHTHPIHKAVKYIQKNILSHISISDLAYDLNMSETNFCNSFKKIMGMTPKEYITNLKLAQAKVMLKSKNVTEVSYDLGYENISHFIALFKNKYGVTPKQYKSMCEGSVVYKY